MSRVKKQVLTFKVTLDLPAKATVAQAKEMLERAIRAEKGQYQPTDPLGNLDLARLSIKLDAKHTYYG